MNNIPTEILFEKFEVIELLKKDAHTSVYLANHIYLGKKIVLKTLDKENLPDDTILSRFKREAKILAKLDHPNLIKVLDFGTHKNNFYISFEYFEGSNLRKVIKEKSLNENEKRELTVQLLKALNVAHQFQIIHRDIKPENILVNENLKLKIADFGLAFVENETVITQKSSIVGTPSYMSPEQIRGERLTNKSDLFSAGIVIFELFTGKNPFIGKDINETINNILNFNKNELLNNAEFIEKDIKELLSFMLAKDDSERVETANDALRVLGVTATIYDAEETVSKIENKNIILFFVSFIIVIAGAIIIYLFAFNQNKISVNSKVDKSSDSAYYLSGKDIFEDSVYYNKQIAPLVSSYLASDTTTEKENKNVNIPGKLYIECSPWADVYINNDKIETTPLDDYITLRPGIYRLKLVHPDFPVYERRIRISPDEIETIKVDLNETVGFLDLSKIYPWGDVYIDGEFIGTSPIRDPVKLSPGYHTLKVTNPNYEDYTERIQIQKHSTYNFELNFENIESENL